MVHKFYAIRDERSVMTGTVVSTLFAVIVAGGSYFLGGFARLFPHAAAGADGAVEYDAIIPAMLEESLPDIMVGVVIVLVLSASMSTLSSLVLTSSSTLTLDFLKLLIFRKMGDRKQQLLAMRALIVFFRPDLRGAGAGSAGLYRPAHGDFLGRPGRRLFGPLPLRAVLEADDCRRPCGPPSSAAWASPWPICI